MTGELWLEDVHVGQRLPTDALCSALQRDDPYRCEVLGQISRTARIHG
jgi:hypothetical protein